MPLDLTAAILAAAPDAPPESWRALQRLGDGLMMYRGSAAHRVSHAIGQGAHESVGFTRTIESLSYRSAERLVAIWPNRFPNEATAQPFVRAPQALANKVYGGRMGNVEPDDGWRYRGRGYFQLTGRDNYQRIGAAIGVDLEDEPGLAAEPEIAWRVADHYLATRTFRGRTAYEWADDDEGEIVTRIVNGGYHGLAGRLMLTAAALAALRGAPPLLRAGDCGPDVLLVQQALARQGFPPGPLDGDFGPLTTEALRRFQSHAGVAVDGVVGDETREALRLT